MQNKYEYKGYIIAPIEDGDKPAAIVVCNRNKGKAILFGSTASCEICVDKIREHSLKESDFSLSPLSNYLS